MLQDILHLNNIDAQHNDIHQKLGRFSFGLIQKVATDSSTITKDTLPPFYAQYYQNETDNRIYYNINNSIISINIDDFTLSGRTNNSIEYSNDKLQLVNDASVPGNSYYYGTDTSGTKGYFVLPSVHLSNVVFSFALGGSSHVADTNGIIINDSIIAANTEITCSYWAVHGTTYRTVITSKFKKISGISTVSIYAHIWDTGSGDGDGYVQVDIGGVSNNVVTSSDDTPVWVTFDLDVSGLTNGTIYDVTIQLKNTSVNPSIQRAYMDSIIGITA